MQPFSSSQRAARFFFFLCLFFLSARFCSLAVSFFQVNPKIATWGPGMNAAKGDQTSAAAPASGKPGKSGSADDDEEISFGFGVTDEAENDASGKPSFASGELAGFMKNTNLHF